MQTFIAITCPHCGEDFETAFDTDEGDAEFVVDCEICCHPMTVSVQMRAGEVGDVKISIA